MADAPSAPPQDKAPPDDKDATPRIRRSLETLRVKAHLMSMDAKKRWEEEIAPEAKEVLHNVEEAGETVSEQVKSTSFEMADMLGAFISSLETSAEEVPEGLIDERALEGYVVMTGDAKAIGKVSGMAINPKTWAVDSLAIKLTSEAAEGLGIERRLWGSHVLRVPTSEVKTLGEDAVLLHLSWKALKKAR